MKTGQESGNQNDKSNLNVTNMSSDIFGFTCPDVIFGRDNEPTGL